MQTAKASWRSRRLIAMPPVLPAMSAGGQKGGIVWLYGYKIPYFAAKNVLNLIIDIGNTVAKLAVFDGGRLVEVARTDNGALQGLPAFVAKWRGSIGKAVVSTVVDLANEVDERLSRLPFPCLRIGGGTPLPVTNLYETPETLGNDRIAAVVGANAMFPGRDILVIDSGTCITYDFVDASSRYHGGNISPGLSMRFKALHAFTSRLPLVGGDGRMPDCGKDTETAIRLGVVRGVEYEVRSYIDEYSRRHPGLLIFLTGGKEFPFEVQTKNEIFADKFLVLKGLNRILEHNASHL